MKAEVLERQTAQLATSYPMRIKTLLKWDPRTDLWLAFVPVLGPLCVRAASRNEVLESTKKAIRSYVDRTVAGGPQIPPASYEEVLEVEVEVPLKRVLKSPTTARTTDSAESAAALKLVLEQPRPARREATDRYREALGVTDCPLASGRDQQGSRTPGAGRPA